jgi:hypothetical protein
MAWRTSSSGPRAVLYDGIRASATGRHFAGSPALLPLFAGLATCGRPVEGSDSAVAIGYFVARTCP